MITSVLCVPLIDSDFKYLGVDNSAEQGFISRVKQEFKEYDLVHEVVYGLSIFIK